MGFIKNIRSYSWQAKIAAQIAIRLTESGADSINLDSDRCAAALIRLAIQEAPDCFDPSSDLKPAALPLVAYTLSLGLVYMKPAEPVIYAAAKSAMDDARVSRRPYDIMSMHLLKVTAERANIDFASWVGSRPA